MGQSTFGVNLKDSCLSPIRLHHSMGITEHNDANLTTVISQLPQNRLPVKRVPPAQLE